MAGDASKHFIHAVIRFIKKEMAERNFPSDTIESLEVATQCLASAYDVPADDDVAAADENVAAAAGSAGSAGETHPFSHVDVFELFCNTCYSVPAEKKQEAENVKNEGNALMREGKPYEALNAYNRAITLDATNPVFYCNRAAAYSKLGEYQKAADDCKMSLRYDSTYSKAYGRLGYAYSKLNQFDKAKEALVNACRLDPDNEDYKTNLTLTQQKYEESLNAPQEQQQPGMNLDLNSLLQTFATEVRDGPNRNALMSVARVLLHDPEVRNLLSSLGLPNSRENISENDLQYLISGDNSNLLNMLSERIRTTLDTNAAGGGGVGGGDTGANNDSESQRQPPEPPV